MFKLMKPVVQGDDEVKASKTGVVKPNTVLIEFRLLRSTEFTNEPTKEGTSVSAKCMKMTSL